MAEPFEGRIMTTPFIPIMDDSSPANGWTPRQALMRALLECDEKAGNWKSVVIIALDGDMRGINATTNRIERIGLITDALLNKWGDP